MIIIRYCDVITATGAYSCLRVDLVFARELSFYIVTIYVPCFMIVVVSWFSFWLDYKAVISYDSFYSIHRVNENGSFATLILSQFTTFNSP